MGKTKTPAAAKATTAAPSPTPAAAPAPWAGPASAENPTSDAPAATDVNAPAADAKNPAASGNGAGTETVAPTVNAETGDGSQQPKADPEATPGPETPKFDEAGNELVTPDNKSNPDDHTPQTAGDAGGFDSDAGEQSRKNLAAEAAARNEENRDREAEEAAAAAERDGDLDFEPFTPSDEAADAADRIDALDDADRAEFARVMERTALDTLKRLERGAEARKMVLAFVEPGTHFGTLAVDALEAQKAELEEDNDDD